MTFQKVKKRSLELADNQEAYTEGHLLFDVGFLTPPALLQLHSFVPELVLALTVAIESSSYFSRTREVLRQHVSPRYSLTFPFQTSSFYQRL